VLCASDLAVDVPADRRIRPRDRPDLREVPPGDLAPRPPGFVRHRRVLALVVPLRAVVGDDAGRVTWDDGVPRRAARAARPVAAAPHGRAETGGRRAVVLR